MGICRETEQFVKTVPFSQTINKLVYLKCIRFFDIRQQNETSPICSMGLCFFIIPG